MANDCRKPCSTCALKPGTVTFEEEPHNFLRAELSVLGGLPFHCHHRKGDEREMENDAEVACSILKGEIPTCAGWRREVAKLARIGYYRENLSRRKDFAKVGLRCVEMLASPTVSRQDKDWAFEMLKEVLRALKIERLKTRQKAKAKGAK
jgi:hypothetical protein